MPDTADSITGDEQLTDEHRKRPTGHGSKREKHHGVEEGTKIMARYLTVVRSDGGRSGAQRRTVMTAALGLAVA